MNITVNGESKELEESVTVATLMDQLGYTGNIGAVAVNMSFIPSDKYRETVLKEGDEVEILAPVCGG